MKFNFFKQNPKNFYKNYLADNNIIQSNIDLKNEILKFSPNSVFEFGCGTGKNLKLFEKNIKTFGIDISEKAIKMANQNMINAICADEKYLTKVENFDVVFTCSVLDHIENIDEIIQHFIRITNKAVILLETNDIIDKFYFPHQYEKYGFTKKHDYKFVSKKPYGDGAIYEIWIIKI